VTQKGFREEDNERLAEIAVDLAPEYMEIVRRSCWVNYLPVAVLVLSLDLFGSWEYMRMVVTEL